ncbi:MAG: hypothetical protein WBL63_14465 [Candidatus Acidiferrum sp.]
MHTRRIFLAGLVLAGVSSGLAGDPMTTQNPVVVPPPKHGQESDEDSAKLPNPDKKILEDNDKDMKKKVDRLYQLATELKSEVNSTDSSKVLSLNLMKKAEEIEKLAREIKNRSKG